MKSLLSAPQILKRLNQKAKDLQKVPSNQPKKQRSPQASKGGSRMGKK